MKTFPTAKIRNVALVGHGGAGKTSLAEALLFNAGAIVRLGRVEDGSTVCDFDPEEQRRNISVSLALAPFELEDHKVNVLDAPGPQHARIFEVEVTSSGVALGRGSGRTKKEAEQSAARVALDAELPETAPPEEE